MDFALTTEQEDIRALAAKILGDFCKPERLPDCERASDHVDRELWKALAGAGLLGVALPVEFGGMGLGIAEACILLEQAGAHVAPVPLLPTLVLGAAPIARFGSATQKERFLPGVVDGSLLLTGALAEADSRDVARPSTRATAREGEWILDGVKIGVPIATSASRIVVPARTADGGVLLALVPPDAEGVALEEQVSTTGQLVHRVALDGVRVGADDVLGAGDAQVVAWWIEHATAALCAMELGVAEKALRMTAKYTSERKQFGKAIATFQAVAQRAADAYIDVEAMRLVTWQAVWRLARGLPATRELSIAKFWASEGGHRACYASQHLHGGFGVDKDYPLHRYYLLSKQIELTLGGAHDHLAALGDRLAAS